MCGGAAVSLVSSNMMNIHSHLRNESSLTNDVPASFEDKLIFSYAPEETRFKCLIDRGAF